MPVKKTEPAEEVPQAFIEIEQVPVATMRVPILGTTELIVHRFSEKAKETMLGAQQGAKKVKEVRDPTAEYEASFYRLKDGRYGFPSLAFKQATVSAARFMDKSVTMTALRQYLYFSSEHSGDGMPMAAIEGEPHMREDVVRLNGRGTDLRYRAAFTEWTTSLDITFVTSCISKNSVLALVDAGGALVGVGEWRPEKNGVFGTYRVDPTRDVEMLS